MATELVKQRLVALMEEHEISQAGVARAIGVRQQKVNLFFDNQMKFPALDFLDAMARVFHHTLADLLAKDLPPPSITKTQQQVLARWKAMDAFERRSFEVVMDRGKGKKR